jgi:aspartate/methionine/tyrosine aminotransferase
MRWRRSAIEAESPEEHGYDRIRCNLAESSVRDRAFSELGVDLGELLLFYGDHRGREDLRALIAQQAGGGLSADDVLVTMGAAGALFLVATALLEPGDRVVASFPNYTTNLETPRAIGAELALCEHRFEEGWRLDPDRLEALVTPETKLISITTPHNPTGQVIPEETLCRLAALAEMRDAWLLVDETYRDLDFSNRLPVAATLSPRVISVASLSKAYGLPGLRVGWVIHRDPALMARLLAAKEQIWITNPVIDEALALVALEERDAWLEDLQVRLRLTLGTLRRWVEGEQRVEWVEPVAGVVCLVRVREDVAVDMERFYEILLHQQGTMVGPGHWFELDRRYMRIGYGWPTHDELVMGLAHISRALTEAGV